MKTVSISNTTHELITKEIEKAKKFGTVPPTIGQIIDSMARKRYPKPLTPAKQADESEKPQPHETTNE